jgi:uncharacterized protein YjiS (DUF1127 family)
MAALSHQAIVHVQQSAHLHRNGKRRTASMTDQGSVMKRKRSEAIMATVNSTRVSSFGVADRFAAFVASYKAAAAQRRVYAKTVAELRDLTDRELTDLGIARVAIEDVARAAAYGTDATYGK